jgi:hypothetical protein
VDTAPQQDHTTPRTAQLGFRVAPDWLTWWQRNLKVIADHTQVPRQTLNLLVLDELTRRMEDVYLRARLISPVEAVRQGALAEQAASRGAHENASENVNT